MSVLSVLSSRTTAARLPRDLHPVAWWLWAIGLAAAATLTTNPLLLLSIVGVVALTVTLRRSEQPWGRSFRLYLVLGILIVVIRVVFRIIFAGTYPGTVLFRLPEIPLPDFVLGITLFGAVTRESLLAGAYDGLRLAAIVICVGAANSLANPKRLLRSVPPALYEIGTALVVAVTILPQLADSARRVRAAQRLRAGDERRIGRLRRFVVPVLEDALERSLALAAGMDTRGYGRSIGASRSQRRTTGALMVAGLAGICVGTYAVLDRTAPRWLAGPMLILGVALALGGLLSAGARVTRTVYRPDPWRWPELAVATSGVAVGAVIWWVSGNQLLVAFPELSSVPPVSVVALVGVLLGLVGTAAAPQPRAATG